MRLIIELSNGEKASVFVGNTQRGIVEAKRFAKDGVIISKSGGEKTSREATFYPPYQIIKMELLNDKEKVSSDEGLDVE